MRLGVVPNRKVDEALRAVAYAIARGEILSTSTEQLLNVVTTNHNAGSNFDAIFPMSGLEYWATMKPKHELIT